MQHPRRVTGWDKSEGPNVWWFLGQFSSLSIKKWANLVILVIFLVAELGHPGGRIGHASPHEGDEIGKQKTNKYPRVQRCVQNFAKIEEK